MNKRPLVEDCWKISVFMLKRYGYLCGFKTGVVEFRNVSNKVVATVGIEVSTYDNYIRLMYIAGERKLDYKVALVTSSCHLGGRRHWLECPSCKTRIGVLYLLPGTERFKCRKQCLGLVYKSQRCSDSRISALKNMELIS